MYGHALLPYGIVYDIIMLYCSRLNNYMFVAHSIVWYCLALFCVLCSVCRISYMIVTKYIVSYLAMSHRTCLCCIVICYRKCVVNHVPFLSHSVIGTCVEGIIYVTRPVCLHASGRTWMVLLVGIDRTMMVLYRSVLYLMFVISHITYDPNKMYHIIPCHIISRCFVLYCNILHQVCLMHASFLRTILYRHLWL